MNRRLLLATAALPVLAACTPGGRDQRAPSGAADLLARHGLEGKSAREVVEALEADAAKRPLSLKASVRVTELQLSDGRHSKNLPLPEDAFYLSIAPYRSQTHDCFFHNLGGCQGELARTPLHVTLTSAEGGTLVDSDTTTHANGFVGFWLPRGINGQLTVSTADGRKASQPVSTGDDAPTCLTTLQLA